MAQTPDSKTPERLLYSRKQTAELLGNVHLDTIRRLENAGRLKPIRLNNGSKSAMIFYRARDVLALAEGAGDA